MTIDEKRQIILQEIAKHNETFLHQASYKINKRFAPDPTDHIELVCDVIYSIVNKLDNKAHINKFYLMVQTQTLHLYILKGIDSNCKYLNAPYLRHKLAQRNRIQIKDNFVITDDIDEDFLEKANELLSYLEPQNAKKIFGDEWKLFTTLLTDYINNPKFTYKDLSIKYKIPLGSISWTMKILKTKMLNAYNENKAKHN